MIRLCTILALLLLPSVLVAKSAEPAARSVRIEIPADATIEAITLVQPETRQRATQQRVEQMPDGSKRIAEYHHYHYYSCKKRKRCWLFGRRKCCY